MTMPIKKMQSKPPKNKEQNHGNQGHFSEPNFFAKKDKKKSVHRKKISVWQIYDKSYNSSSNCESTIKQMKLL